MNISKFRNIVNKLISDECKSIEYTPIMHKSRLWRHYAIKDKDTMEGVPTIIYQGNSLITIEKSSFERITLKALEELKQS